MLVLLQTPLSLLLLAALAVLLLVPPARWAARKSGFVDRPGGRKRHERAVPPIGGLLIFPVFMALGTFVIQDWAVYGWLYAALALLLVTGGLDDRFHVPAWIKFGVQFIVAILIVWPGSVQVISMGNLFGFGDVQTGWISIPFSVIATVLLINAVNLMDGLDGLAGGTGLMILGWLAVTAAMTGSPVTMELMILCGGLIGFLAYNIRHPWRAQASIFLGDSGSMALGLVIAWYAIGLSQGDTATIAPVSVAWLLALPIMDTCGQFARRVSEGRHPFSPDHHHFHHHFITAGLKPGQATACILSLVFIHGVIGVAGIMLGLPPFILMYIWIALLFTHIYMSMRPHRFRRLILRVVRPGESTIG